MYLFGYPNKKKQQKNNKKNWFKENTGASEKKEKTKNEEEKQKKIGLKKKIEKTPGGSEKEEEEEEINEETTEKKFKEDKEELSDDEFEEELNEGSNSTASDTEGIDSKDIQMKIFKLVQIVFTEETEMDRYNCLMKQSVNCLISILAVFQYIATDEEAPTLENIRNACDKKHIKDLKCGIVDIIFNEVNKVVKENESEESVENIPLFIKDIVLKFVENGNNQKEEIMLFLAKEKFSDNVGFNNKWKKVIGLQQRMF